MTDIIIPLDLWDDDREGVVLTWMYADGATVNAGAPLLEVTVEKAQMDIVAPASGRLWIQAVPDTIVRRGQVIGRIEPT